MDDSFKKPGSIPFKWEIRPGVPKQKSPSTKTHFSPPTLVSPSPPSFISSRSADSGPGTRSFRSSTPSRAHSERWRADPHTQQQAEVVAPGGCFVNFPKLLLLRKRGKEKKDKENKNKNKNKKVTTTAAYDYDYDYASDGMDTYSSSRWSVSSRRSLSPSPFMDSPASPYSSYNYSSSYRHLSPHPPPRPSTGNADWAGFGLF